MPPAFSIVEKLQEAAALVRGRPEFGQEVPHVGLVLGSGLGAFADRVAPPVASPGRWSGRIPYADIPNMPVPRVEGHSGELVWGTLREGDSSARVVCLSGRSHLYEGHELGDVVFGVRLLAELGCNTVLLTNAAGGLRSDLKPGSLLLIRDHLNLTGRNPLVGPNDERLGPRFPDMTEAYSMEVRSLAYEVAVEQGIELTDGIYAGLLGPNYETPAEIEMLRRLGADAVGMSTVLEVIALRHRHVRVGALSCITNLAAGLSEALLDHAEVQIAANAARDRLTRLMTGWCLALAGH